MNQLKWITDKETGLKRQVEICSGEHITDQTGAISKAELVYQLGIGAIQVSNRLTHGQQVIASTGVELFENGLNQALNNFDTAVHSELEKARLAQKSAVSGDSKSTAEGTPASGTEGAGTAGA